jgi:hypothetical protein
MLKLSTVPLLCDLLRNIIYETSVEAEGIVLARPLSGRGAIENRPGKFKSVF